VCLRFDTRLVGPSCIGGAQHRPERIAQRDLRAAAELDCDPVMVTPSGALVVDVRVCVAAVAPGRPFGGRR